MDNRSYLQMQIESERSILIAEMERNEQRRKELLKAIIAQTTYKKGEVTKEVFKLPMLTSKNFLDNKDLSIKTYGALMLESNWGGKFLNQNDRYIYNDRMNEVIEKISVEMQISQRTIKKYITKLKKCNIKAIEPFKTNKGDLVYRLNYSVPKNENTEDFHYGDYVTITNVALRILVNAYSEHALRIYLFMLYKCYKKPLCHIKQSEICEAIGLKPTSRAIITDNINALIDAGFIYVKKEYEVNDTINRDGEQLDHVIPNYYYALSDKYLIKKL